MAGSNWSSDYDMVFLEKGEEEKKSDYKARLKAQKEEMIQKLLNPEQQALLKEYMQKDHEAYMEWEDRVMGRVKKKQVIERGRGERL